MNQFEFHFYWHNILIIQKPKLINNNPTKNNLKYKHKNCTQLSSINYHLSPKSPMEGQFIIQQYQKFQSLLKSRQRIRIPIDQTFQAQLDMMEYVILSRFQKNAKTLYKEKNNKHCDKSFKRGFKQLMDVEKIYYYNMVVTHFQNITNQDLTQPVLSQLSQSLKSPGYSKTYSKIGWKQVLLKLDLQKRYLYIQQNNKLKVYDLNYYILRKSKTTQYNSFVLQAINGVISQKGQQLHVGFKDVKVFREWFDGLKKLVEYMFWERIRNMLFPPQVVEIIVGREEEVANKESSRKAQMDKLCMSSIIPSSTLVKSQTNLPSQQAMHSLSKSVVTPYYHPKSQAQSYNYKQKQIQSEQVQKSQQKSINSLSIYSQRSSLKHQMIQCQLKDQVEEGDCETFRSFAQLTGEEVLEEDVQEKEEDMRVFRKLLPDYDLQSVSQVSQQQRVVYSSEEMKIYSFSANPKRLRTLITLQRSSLAFPIQHFASLLCTSQFYKQLNQQIQQLQTKTILTTDHCLILYQKNKQYNRLYRSRDFVFVRHIFVHDNKFYIVDKSVQDTNVPPFTTIVRGQLRVVYQIVQQGELFRLSIDAIVQNFGYLKDLQQMNINIKFFKGFEGIVQRVKNASKNNIMPVFQMKKAKIYKEKQNNKEDKTQSLEQLPGEQAKTKQQDETISKQQSQPQPSQQLQHQQPSTSQQSITQPYTIPLPQAIQQLVQSVQKMQLQGEISTFQPKQLISQQKIIRNFDSQGQIILSNQHLTKHHPTVALQFKQPTYLKSKDNQHPIWKGNWEFLPQGGFKFVNQKQIQQQKNVLKFILSQVAKNLVSGKSILNISLPVDIFSADSNLQRFIFSMGYAPLLLQPACTMSQLDRFLHSIVFGMTTSPLYLQMQKPFNPVIGETFQCYINGCPAYAQQISHHPPIAAFMLVGRGYRVSAQIQSKMKLNINSGTGYNAGVYRMRYDQSQDEVCYMSPSGEVSGLAYGERKFNFTGRAYAWCQKSGLFVQIQLNPKKGGFFGKQDTPIDYFQGRIYQVKQPFLKQFSKSLTGQPKKTQITKQYGKFHGRWNKSLFYQQKQLFSYDTTFPLQLEHQQSPLPSDSNWRQDITYRRLLQISSAQVWKEKLEVKQREERKLREKYWSGKK